jgi:amidophosphoribosyltransferase/formyltetrahydrofolate-dependent phosphoribosylglycinamide formyltransferase
LQERPKYSNWDETLLHVLPQVKGAFCFVILTSDGTMYGARDPYGIRPFCLGKYDDGWIMASESVAADLTGAEFLRDIKPGEIVKIGYDGALTSFFFGEPKRPQNCIFEYIYFSRPDSFENGIRVKSGREESGRLLGKRILKKGIKADAIVPVFDSGYPAAKGVEEVLDLPIIDAITVSHYIGRTFIQPGHENRMAAVNGKHNIVPDEIIGKRIIVVDDSAVRLTTSKRLQRGLKDAGAKEVYMVFASPPVVNHCDLGIDMKSKKELPASQWENEPLEVIEENVAKLMGADGVVYLPIEETAKAMGGVKENFYHYPFGGPHPIRDNQHVFPKMKRKITGTPKITVFASGMGTNLEEIIKRIDSGDLNAKIVSVVVNRPDAYAKSYAENNSIPTYVLPYEGNLKDLKNRKVYEKKLFEHIKKVSPDIIVLTGWMLVLGDEFLAAAQTLEIPVLNLHPALLTEKLADHIMTSRGMIPVIRGSHAIAEAFRKELLVSGVTVHQVLPKNYFDIGPVILTEEVRRRKDDTLETFEKRIHEAEYRVLPTAIKRVLHVMKQGVDINRGNFYW